MDVVKEVKKVIEDSKYKTFHSGEFAKAAQKYNDMVEKGVVIPRGNCLMSPSQLYTQSVIFNKNK